MQFWLIMPVRLLQVFFAKLGPQSFGNCMACSILHFVRRISRKNTRELMRKETAMQCVTIMKVV